MDIRSLELVKEPSSAPSNGSGTMNHNSYPQFELPGVVSLF